MNLYVDMAQYGEYQLEGPKYQRICVDDLGTSWEERVLWKK